MDKELLAEDLARAENDGELALISFIEMCKKQINNLEYNCEIAEDMDDHSIYPLINGDTETWKKKAIESTINMMDVLLEWQAAAEEKLGRYDHRDYPPKRARRVHRV